MGVKIKTIRGLCYEEDVPKTKDIIVRFTSDKYGETISLDDGETMLAVDFKEVKAIIKKARKGHENVYEMLGY